MDEDEIQQMLADDSFWESLIDVNDDFASEAMGMD